MDTKDSIIKLLKSLPVNYADSNFQDAYFSLQEKIDVGSYLEYQKEKRPKEFTGLFHFALSVKVLPEGEFIPFVLITNNDEQKEEETKKWSQDLFIEKRVKYNYTSFIDDVIALLVKEKKLKQVELSEILFCTYYSESRKRYFIDEIKFDKDGSWKEPIIITYQTSKDIIDKVNDLLCNYDNFDFIQLLSDFYHTHNHIEKLYWGLYAFDSDYLTKTKLTEFLVISEHEGEIRPFFLEKVRKIRDLTSYIRTRFTRDLLEKNRYEATKSAKAAIMSRNMSHNLGSHVMSYLKQHLSSVTTMMRDNVLHEIISHKLDSLPSWNETISKNQVNENIALPFLVGIGHFISYLQERQDFIATIATDYIPYNSTVNFKDNIYDELNPDKRYERHSERSNLQIDNILLGNIARSEGLGRHTSPTKGEGSKLCDIVIKFGEFDGNLGSSEDDLSRLRDFNVSLPGGIVGRQAIFSILENIIRNAAKHGNWKNSGKLELEIDYYSKNTIELAADNDQHEGCHSLRKVLTDFYVNATDGEDLYFLTITDNSETDIEHLIKLRKSLCDSYMNNANKGLKEMRISSSWLRSISDEESCYNPYQPYLGDSDKLASDSFAINDKLFRAPIIYARLHVSDEYLPPCLQYIICLPIPREVALITSETADATWKARMLKQNWRVYTENETVHEFLDQESNKSFEFVLCDTRDMYNKIRPFTSVRTFCLSDSGLNLSIDKFKEDYIDSDSILKSLYSHLSEESQNEVIVIDDSTVFHKAVQQYEEGLCEKVVVNAVDKELRAYSITHVTVYHKGRNGNTVDNVEIQTEVDKKDYEGFPDGTYYRIGSVVVGNAGKPIYTRFSYRTHHEAWDQFKRFMEDAEKHSIVYVEGITGNNATDRLVRHDSLTTKWYCSHIHSMKQKVAIMDERIFYKIYGIDEASFVRGLAYVSKTDFSSGDKDRAEDLNIAKKYYKGIIPEEAYERIDDASDISTLQNIISEDFSSCIRRDTVYAKGYMGYAYFQKGIMIYTFIPAPDKNKFEIVGLQINDDGTPEKNDSYECVCIPITTLEWKDGELSIEPLQNYMEFNFISIHQGLLDKLYEAFDVKDDIHAKNAIVAKLYGIFSCHHEEEIIDDSFYPGFFIHSGRSKPGTEVMSQKVPFIQYATLEHAVLDCKYSLIELLDNARYE